MKKVWIVLFAIILAVAICTAALTEGLEIEYDESFDLAVMAAEMTEEEDADITSQAVELPVPEASEALLPGIGDETGDADAEFVGEFAVSAAGDVAIDKINFPTRVSGNTWQGTLTKMVTGRCWKMSARRLMRFR